MEVNLVNIKLTSFISRRLDGKLICKIYRLIFND